jgi:hypothetical protein
MSPGVRARSLPPAQSHCKPREGKEVSPMHCMYITPNDQSRRNASGGCIDTASEIWIRKQKSRNGSTGELSANPVPKSCSANHFSSTSQLSLIAQLDYLRPHPRVARREPGPVVIRRRPRRRSEDAAVQYPEITILTETRSTPSSRDHFARHISTECACGQV